AARRSPDRWSSGRAAAATSPEQLLGQARVRRSSSATATAADRHAKRHVAGEPRPCCRAGMSASVVPGHHLEVFMSRAPIAVLVFDPRIRKPNVPVVVRQLVLACPPRDLLGCPVRPAIAVLPAAVALVQEPLVVPLELVIEDDAPDTPALVAQARLSPLVSGVDPGVMR